MAKNRRLLEELTKLRVSWEDLSGQHAKSEDVIEGLEGEVTRQKTLNERLENDLMAVNKGTDVDIGKEKVAMVTPAQGLAGLDIGGKPVCAEDHSLDLSLPFHRMAKQHLPHWQLMAIHPSFPLSPASVTASVNATLSLKRYVFLGRWVLWC